MGTGEAALLFVAVFAMLMLCWRPIAAALGLCLVGVLLVGIVQVVQYILALS